MRISRGLHGTPIPGGEEVGYYRFEFDHPGYHYSLAAEQGDKLVKWVESKIEIIRAHVEADAAQFDALPSNFLSAMSYELRGIGSRETDERGNPVWEEGQRFPMWREYRDWTVAVRELLSRVQAVGDNDLEKVPNATRKPGSKPVYYKLLGLVVRVITDDLRDISQEAREYFAGKEIARRKRIVKRIREGKRRNEEEAKREELQRRAKKAAATRKKNALAKKRAEAAKREANRQRALKAAATRKKNALTKKRELARTLTETAKREAYRQRALKAAATRKKNALAKKRAEAAKREANRQRALKAAATRKKNAKAKNAKAKKRTTKRT